MCNRDALFVFSIYSIACFYIKQLLCICIHTYKYIFTAASFILKEQLCWCNFQYIKNLLPTTHKNIHHISFLINMEKLCKFCYNMSSIEEKLKTWIWNKLTTSMNLRFKIQSLGIDWKVSWKLINWKICNYDKRQLKRNYRYVHSYESYRIINKMQSSLM